jgi:hypothetical protein
MNFTTETQSQVKRSLKRDFCVLLLVSASSVSLW